MTIQALIPSRARTGITALALAAMVMPIPAMADAFVFSTDNSDGLIATATRPSSPGEFEVETGDDFVLTQQTLLPGAAFTGLIPSGASRSDEVYRVFPADSDVNRSSGSPTFSMSSVPTRVNSQSDVALDDRDSSNPSLKFVPIVLQTSFTANNSITPGGIHSIPGQTSGASAAAGLPTLIAAMGSLLFLARRRRLRRRVGEF